MCFKCVSTHIRKNIWQKNMSHLLSHKTPLPSSLGSHVCRPPKLLGNRVLWKPELKLFTTRSRSQSASFKTCSESLWSVCVVCRTLPSQLSVFGLPVLCVFDLYLACSALLLFAPAPTFCLVCFLTVYKKFSVNKWGDTKLKRYWPL